MILGCLQSCEQAVKWTKCGSSTVHFGAAMIVRSDSPSPHIPCSFQPHTYSWPEISVASTCSEPDAKWVIQLDCSPIRGNLTGLGIGSCCARTLASWPKCDRPHVKTVPASERNLKEKCSQARGREEQGWAGWKTAENNSSKMENQKYLQKNKRISERDAWLYIPAEWRKIYA